MLYYALKNQATHMHNTCIHVQKHNCLGQGDKEGGGGGGDWQWTIIPSWVVQKLVNSNTGLIHCLCFM